MLARLLTPLVLIAVVAPAAAQEPPPVFRSDAYVVAIDYQPIAGAPMLGLTSNDFTVVIDKRVTVPVRVVSDEARPGFYRITFSPPEALRDGKKHRVDVARTNKKPMRFQLTFERPKKPDDDASKK
jgi:hypothetical protein